MLKFILRRIAIAVPIVLIVTILCFLLISIAPYDAIDSMIDPKMSADQIAAIKEKYGYDQPIWIRYIRWLGGMLTGNFGFSVVNKASVAEQLASRIPNTIMLVLPAYLVAYVLAIVLGIVAGARRGSIADRIIDACASVGISIPSFWFAMMLIFIFGYTLKCLPILGMHAIGNKTFADLMRHFILPFTTLTVAFLPDNLRYVRSSTITQTTQDYVQVQQAFGATNAQVMFRHICRNVLAPVITRLGMAMPMLVTGAIITETIFSWPGVGPYFITAIKGMDYPVIMTILVLSSTLVVLGNLLADVLNCLVDPRVREGSVDK